MKELIILIKKWNTRRNKRSGNYCKINCGWTHSGVILSILPILMIDGIIKTIEDKLESIFGLLEN